VKASDLREFSKEELAQRLKERLDDVRTFRFQAATGTVENTRGARNARRDIARIKTILRELELAEGKNAK